MKKSILLLSFTLLTISLTLCAFLLCGPAALAAEPEETSSGESGDTQESCTVTWIVDGKTSTETYTAGETPAYKGSTDKASDGQFSYKFKGWDSELKPVAGNITYTAVYEKTEILQSFTVTWVVDGKTSTETYKAGETPAYKGSTDKAADGDYSYRFNGWSPEIGKVTGNVSYTALYERIAHSYTVTWVVDGKTSTEAYAAGETPAYKGSTDKDSDKEYSYKFKGWDRELKPVAGNVTYTAVYEKTAREYTVTWVVDGTITKENYKAGETPVFKGSTDKASDGSYAYLFKGWDSELKPVSGDVVYTAEYDKAERKFTVTWIVDGVSSTENYAFGETPSYKGSTEKAPNGEIAYRFKGWSSELLPVTGDISFTAVYEETAREYTVTWMVSGKPITESYPYGATPVFKGSTDKASDGGYSYTFSGWDRELQSVSGDITYTAVYKQTPLTPAAAPEKNSILSSPLFWILIILVGLVSLSGIALLVLQKLNEDYPGRFPWVDSILALLPGARKSEEKETRTAAQRSASAPRNAPRRNTGGMNTREVWNNGDDVSEGDVPMDATRQMPPLHTTGQTRIAAERRQQRSANPQQANRQPNRQQTNRQQTPGRQQSRQANSRQTKPDSSSKTFSLWENDDL